MHTFSLAGSTALVTGSSQGIGFAIAHGLHRAGATVVFHGKDAAAPEMPSNSIYLEANLLETDAPAPLVMLTSALAQSLASHHIRVNGIAPGLIRTPLTAGVLNTDKQKHYEKKILLGPLGEPEDCAGAAVFLLSSAARYITGQIIVVD